MESLEPLPHSISPPPSFEADDNHNWDTYDEISLLRNALKQGAERESSRAKAASKTVSLVEARAAVARRQTVALAQKVREKDAQLANLEDTVAALSGRVESEITRSDKMSTQNQLLKELVEKQAKLHAKEGTREDPVAAAMSANERCCSAEGKLSALIIENRSTQRKMARELETHMRRFEAQRKDFEAELNALRGANESLKQAVREVAAVALLAGAELPAIAAAEIAIEESHVNSEISTHTIMTIQHGQSVQVRLPDKGIQTESQDEPRLQNTRSPLPFRRFVGKRAASPVRSLASSSTNSVPDTKVTSSIAGSMTKSSAVARKTTVVTPRGGDPDDEIDTKRREAAQKKHAARLRAVRGSSRGKWGFSV